MASRWKLGGESHAIAEFDMKDKTECPKHIIEHT